MTGQTPPQPTSGDNPEQVFAPKPAPAPATVVSPHHEPETATALLDPDDPDNAPALDPSDPREDEPYEGDIGRLTLDFSELKLPDLLSLGYGVNMATLIMESGVHNREELREYLHPTNREPDSLDRLLDRLITGSRDSNTTKQREKSEDSLVGRARAIGKVAVGHAVTFAQEKAKRVGQKTKAVASAGKQLTKNAVMVTADISKEIVLTGAELTKFAMIRSGAAIASFAKSAKNEYYDAETDFALKLAEKYLRLGAFATALSTDKSKMPTGLDDADNTESLEENEINKAGGFTKRDVVKALLLYAAARMVKNPGSRGKLKK